MTINSFPDKIKLQYTPVYSIHQEDVISEEKTRIGGEGVGGKQQEKEKNGQVRGELNMDGALGLCSE